MWGMVTDYDSQKMRISLTLLTYCSLFSVYIPSFEKSVVKIIYIINLF